MLVSAWGKQSNEKGDVQKALAAQVSRVTRDVLPRVDEALDMTFGSKPGRKSYVAVQSDGHEGATMENPMVSLVLALHESECAALDRSVDDGPGWLVPGAGRLDRDAVRPENGFIKLDFKVSGDPAQVSHDPAVLDRWIRSLLGLVYRPGEEVGAPGSRKNWISYWLYAGATPLTAVRGPLGMADQDVRYKAISENESVPLCNVRYTPYEFNSMLALAEVRVFGGDSEVLAAREARESIKAGLRGAVKRLDNQTIEGGAK